MLQLFGRPTLTNPSGDRVDLSPGGWRLLAAVAAAPEGVVSRAELANLAVPTGKLGTLRKLVWSTRQALESAGLSIIESDGDVLRLSNNIACDLRDLRIANPERPCFEIYRGRFFDATSTFEHPPWKVWLARQREDWRDLYIDKVSKILTSANLDRTTRKQEAHHLLRQAPNHATATQALMLEAARASDPVAVRRWYGDLRVGLEAEGERPDRRTTDVLYRLVGASQRRLGAVPVAGEVELPTIYIPPPSATSRSRGVRMVRSLLVDIAIGLCRASLFRVISSTPGESRGSRAGSGPLDRSASSYLVSTSILDHVVGQHLVFTLLSLPEREILWTEKVEAKPGMSIEAYNLLTAGVLQSLVQRIQDLEVDAFRLDTDPGAYGLFLAGSSTMRSLNLVALRRGRHHLRRSLSQSTGFAPTASALARSYAQEWLVAGRGEGNLLEKARELSLHAIASDPLEARAFSSLGFCDLFEKRYDSARESYAKAEQLNRSFADLISEHANCLMHCGLLEDALAKIDYAMRMNPNGGDLYKWCKASTCFLMARYEDVLTIIDDVEDGEPTMRLLAATHALLGNKDEAERCRMKALETFPSMTIAKWTSTIALRDPEHVQHYVEGLALAGFQ